MLSFSMSVANNLSPSAIAAPTTDEQRAEALGLPATLFGFTPSQGQYWREPGLPWWTPELRDKPFLDYQGKPILPLTAWVQGNSMAPRFPDLSGVIVMPVGERKNLVIGKVYTYSYRNAESGELEMTFGRLKKIAGNYLEVAADNPSPDEAHPTIWLLREDEKEAVWDVREVTHYINYPIR
jgi:hypothetical protein